MSRITTLASDIRNDHKSLDQMLRTPTGRGGLGDISLDGILSGHLPMDSPLYEVII